MDELLPDSKVAVNQMQTILEKIGFRPQMKDVTFKNKIWSLALPVKKNLVLLCFDGKIETRIKLQQGLFLIRTEEGSSSERLQGTKEF